MGQPWGPQFNLTYNLAFAHRSSQIPQGAGWNSIGPLLAESEGIARAHGFSAEHARIQALINKYQGKSVPSGELNALLQSCLGGDNYRHAGAHLGWARGSCAIGIVNPNDPAIPGALRDQIQDTFNFLQRAGAKSVAQSLKNGALKEADKGTLSYHAVLQQIERFMVLI
jgi:hypothetical protein